MSSLADKLKSLGVKTGTAHLSAPKPASPKIDLIVPGIFLQTPRGEAFVAEQAFDEEYLHGKTSPYSEFPRSIISQWANDPRIAELPMHKFAFLDTETSGMAGGTGTYAFLVGAGRFVDGKFVLQQFFFAFFELIIDFYQRYILSWGLD